MDTPGKTSLENFFDSLYSSYLEGKTRNPQKDLQKLLRILRVKYHIESEQTQIANMPTIIAVNHFVRPLLLRKTLFTTIDSMITSAIVTQSHRQIAGRKLTWVVKNDLFENLFFLSLKARKIQLAAIGAYNFIGVSKSYPFGDFGKWASFLKRGYDVAVYPEGKVSQSIKKSSKGFSSLISFLNSRDIKFQILPASIYWHQNNFSLYVSRPLTDVRNPSKTANLAMTQIASKLPYFLRGEYKNKVEEAEKSTFQPQQQQAGDQKQELAARKVFSK